MNRNISDLRVNYDQGQLNQNRLDKDPIHQYQIWLEEALNADIPEPNAMTLCTTGRDGPSARIVLLKEVNDEGFIFFTNYKSQKAVDIEVDARVALVFLWKEQQRQVRITGVATKISRQKSEEYFHSRPRESQIGAWTSFQSQVIEGRELLEQRNQELIKRFKEQKQIPLPDFWGGYCVSPEKIEFWQGRPDRLHDRFRYTLIRNNWILERLSP